MAILKFDQHKTAEYNVAATFNIAQLNDCGFRVHIIDIATWRNNVK